MGFEAAGLTELERNSVAGARWWTCQELTRAHETVYPTRLAELPRTLLDEGPPAGPVTLDREIVQVLTGLAHNGEIARLKGNMP
jgi:hypothetical protein